MWVGGWVGEWVSGKVGGWVDGCVCVESCLFENLVEDRVVPLPLRRRHCASIHQQSWYDPCIFPFCIHDQGPKEA